MSGYIWFYCLRDLPADPHCRQAVRCIIRHQPSVMSINSFVLPADIKKTLAL
jgi:hypothetical protein